MCMVSPEVFFYLMKKILFILKGNLFPRIILSPKDSKVNILFYQGIFITDISRFFKFHNM